MPETVLRTKLYVPRLRTNLVPRLQLIDRLNQGLQLGNRLTLISAPAGFGKTTLVSEWFASCKRPVAWLSLDKGDNDPPRFLTYFVAALHTLAQSGAVKMSPTFGLDVLAGLQSAQPQSIELILTLLLNEITTIQEEFLFVLDDYHVIDAQAIDHVLTFLLDHLPPQMHLIIATREDPHLPLPRLRARGQLTELRATDLRFTLAEATEFLNQVMGLGLSAEDVAALETRTEGWIAGLQLAALSMQGRVDPARLIKTFTGSHRLILDYLIEEVLEQQPESIQGFLLQTAVLDRMTGALCDALTNQSDGQATLESLDHANLFIVPLDETRHWYRYHHLFADLLRQRLRQSQQDIVPTLHDRASEWYAQNGFINDAIDHALRARDFQRAAQLLKGLVETIWQRGEHTKLRRWLLTIPLKIVLSEPKLCIFHAWYLFANGQHDLAGEVLQAAELALDANGTQLEYEELQLQGRIAAVRSFMASYCGEVPAIIRQARQALALLPENDLTWRSSAAITLGDAHGFSGDMTAAYEARLAAAQSCQASGDLYFLIIANLKLAITLRAQGKLQATIDMCRQQMHMMRDKGLASTPMAGWCLAVWGEALAELNDLDGALYHAQKGIELMERGVDLAMRGWSYLCLVRILFSRGETAEVEAIIQILADLERESDIPPWITNQMVAWQARLWLAQENVVSASHWMVERGLDIAIENKTLPQIDFFLLIDYITVARILLAQGRLGETIWLLQNLHKVAEAGGRITRLIEVKLLQALAFQARDNRTQALNALQGAITFAEPEGFMRIFMDEGPPMTRLLQTAVKHQITPDYVALLLTAVSAAKPEQTISPQTQSAFRIPHSAFVEPLSERELEVLQYIAAGLTNQKIADRLFLSLNTVKVHTRNIYSKLDVHTRTQAVAKARSLGILSTL